MAPDPEQTPLHPDEEPSREPGAEPGRLVGSPHVVAAHDALLALTRAARSFTLYDPANEVVHTLIVDYRDKLRHVLDTFGTLALEVHAFELVLGSEVVYVEKDRERSLAFRLFRDGIRKLRFDAGTTWEEQLRLLEILSIRYTGVRQQEDDLVTLLRKAAFDHVTITAIEGFVPEEEQAETTPARGRVAVPRYEPPARWDAPPPLGEAAALRYRSVPDELLERLHAEEAPETAGPHAVRAAVGLLAAASDAELAAARTFALEVRDFLFVERSESLVIDLARGCAGALANRPEAMSSFLDAYLDAPTVDALVVALPPGTTEVPPHLTEVLAAAPGAVTGRLLDRLLAEGDGPRAPLLRRLVAHGCRLSGDMILARLQGSEGATRVGLMRLLGEVDPATSLRVAQEATTSEDPEVLMEALRQLEMSEFRPEVARALRHLLESPVEDVRVATLPVMARGGVRVMATLVAHAEKNPEALSPAEAEATGRALAQADPRAALQSFEAWLHPQGGTLLGRFSKGLGPVPLQRAVLAGLESIGGPEAEALLKLLGEKGDGEIAAAAHQMTRQRRSPGGAP
jgi:hypothetical protein